VNEPHRIDHWDVLGRSVRFAWKHKVLWVLGFFASVSGQNLLSWVQEEQPPFLHGRLFPRLEAVAAVVVVLVLVWIGLVIVNTIARAGLIASSAEADRGGSPSFERAVVTGARALLGMLAILLIGAVLGVAGTLVCVVPVVLPLAAGVPGVVIAVLVGAILLLPYLAFLFGLTFTVTFAERALVADRLSILDALAAGWRLARSRYLTALVAWLVALLAGIVYGVGLVLALVVLGLPLVFVWFANKALALALGIPLLLVVVLPATGAYGTFAYAFWTLQYLRLRGPGAEGGGVRGEAGPAAPPGVTETPSGSREDLLAGSI
jgi:hypothetical protein